MFVKKINWQRCPVYMKIQYKASIIMISLGIVVILSTTFVFSYLNKRTSLQEELRNIKNLSYETAHHLDLHLNTNIEVSRAFAEAPVIKEALTTSNNEFESISKPERLKKIETLNKQWMETDNTSDPFIQKRLDNPSADFLKSQQIISPGQYGEIFLTNKFGLMISSTGKLTTLAHSHKYWWKSCYYNGKGRIFLDDRGFDDSVNGYVLGIVVPIYDNNEIIGIIKNNINLEEVLYKMIYNFDTNYKTKIQIVRSNGLVIAEKGKEPLSTSLDEIIIPIIGVNTTGSEIIEIQNTKTLLAWSPVQISLNSDLHGFGGSNVSIDHSLGNVNESWHIVLSLDENIAFADVNRTTRLIMITEILFTIISSVFALLMGKWFSKPIINLANLADKIGKGNLDLKANIKMKDEIGILSASINKMTNNLKRTMASRDELSKEIKLRKEAEKIAHLGSWELDLINNKLQWSDEIYNIYELNPEDVNPAYELFLQHIHPEDREFVNESYTNFVESKTPYDIVHRIILKDGTIKIINERCKTIYSDNGSSIRSVGTVQDITKQKQMEDELARQLKEKEIILQETHHRMKNNFASIGSLLQLQSSSLTNPEAISAVQDAYGRVNSMSKLYENMLLDSNYKESSVKDYMGKLIDDISNLFLNKKNIVIEQNINDFNLNSKDLVALGIILNELLTNIMKYAFAGRDSGLIDIMIEKNVNDITLTIQDNGIGLPEGFNINTQTGFGLQLINMLTEQLRGNFKIESKNGTLSTLEFPI